MKNLDKAKSIVEWVVSIILKLRPKKTYWSIAVPYSLLILGELGKNSEKLVNFANESYSSADHFLEKLFWIIFSFFLNLDLPWFSLLILTVIFLGITTVYIFELRSKRKEQDLSTEQIVSSLSDVIFKKITPEIYSLLNKLTFKPNDAWFKNQCRASLCDLGNRYTPELNLELEESGVFDGLGRTESFEKEVSKQFDQLIIKGKKILQDKPEIIESIKQLEACFDSIYDLHSSINFYGTNNIPTEDLLKLLREFLKITEVIQIHYIEMQKKLKKDKKSYQFKDKYAHELKIIREFQYELSKFTAYINSSTFKVANYPILILDGEAGIGKSHMLGDIISKRIKNKYESIFLLGQHLVTDEDPWTQIFKRLQIHVNADDFLSAINKRGKKTGKRIVFFIDAINEGRGKYFWASYINSFINEIGRYEWIGLVLTIRSSYKNLIFPLNEKSDLKIIEHTLYGFRSVEYEASKLFFNNYKIELPNTPHLHPEFQNPLFLKLFCEGISKSGLSRVPDGLQGISSIINFFIKSVNGILTKPNRLNYSSGLNLVKKSIDAIIYYKIENQLKYVPYEKAFEIIEDMVSKFIEKKGVIEELISEGIFSKNLFLKSDGDYEEGIYLAYERFEDHLISQYLLEKYPDLDSEFKEDGKLYQYVKDKKSIYMNKGLVDAFTIQIPEKTDKELFHFIPHFKDEYLIMESFVNSLLWRKFDTITERTKDYVNNHVCLNEETHELFWETILSVTALPGHYYNAYSLHKYLMKFSMPERDAGWSYFLKYKFDDDSSIKQLIDWAWNEKDKTHISDEPLKLACIALAWFHTTTNRKIRDSATKALICLLQDRLNVLLDVLKLFEGVNDPYVYERLFAVAYGCALRTKQKEYLSELSEYIFKIIFNNDGEIYPHALLRDYARGVIEFSLYSGCKLSFNINLVRPPYKSTFPDSIMSNNEIDSAYKFDFKAKDYKSYYWSQNQIISSMTTEHGRGIGSYGDFGRYTFESALSAWDVNTNDLSNLALEWIFEKYGYDVDSHEKYDNNLNSIDRSSVIVERIGIKYQWIALHEMVARVSDNFKKYDQWSFKKEVEEPYQGPWSPYIRDIDPSMTITNTANYNEDSPTQNWWATNNTFNWDSPNNEWIKNLQDLPNVENLVQVKDPNNENWLVLESYPEWAEPKKIGEEKWNYPHKRIWYQIRSYLVKNEEYTKLRDWSSDQDFMGRWMPENSDRYEIFSREYYWSSIHKYFKSEYYDDSLWREIYDKESKEFIASVIIPTESYMWENEFDKSKEETISFLKPCTSIYEGMNLKYSRNEGEFLNSSGEIVCFAANVYYESKSFLLIKEESFLKYLKENDLNIIWTILSEKQIIGGRSFNNDDDDDDVGRLELSGTVYFDNKKIKSTINIKNT